MSKKKYKEDKAEKKLGAIDEKLTASEQFLEKNQKAVLYGLAAVVVVVGIFLAYRFLYVIPKNEKARAAMFKGERYFQNEEDSLALFGNNNDYIGFEAIIDRYKGTKTANLAYALCRYLLHQVGRQRGKRFAISLSLKGRFFDCSAVMGAIGDVYMNMNNPKEAVAHYKKLQIRQMTNVGSYLL